MSQAPAPPQDEVVVLLFASIHDVLAAEAWAKQCGLWCDLCPVPRPLSSDCGMVLELGMEGWERLGAVLCEQYRLKVAYLRTPGGHMQMWPNELPTPADRQH